MSALTTGERAARGGGVLAGMPRTISLHDRTTVRHAALHRERLGFVRIGDHEELEVVARR